MAREVGNQFSEDEREKIEDQNDLPPSPNRECLEVLLISSNESKMRLDFMEEFNDFVSIDCIYYDLVEMFRDGVQSDNSLSPPPTSSVPEVIINEPMDSSNNIMNNWLLPYLFLDLGFENKQDN
eukprot:Gb_18472 [translate_table: standard]